ncbi:hypothetical protein D4L85_02245 [Chryseolinea soli]|uniref:Uncharacterized protein n=1 Tax=Chryseolinea soli TaxID=2321403 RepID=A0A385SEV9_9BACT|nr:hypothetical protein D4L85_02245 [Chryseolinea soli]
MPHMLVKRLNFLGKVRKVWGLSGVGLGVIPYKVFRRFAFAKAWRAGAKDGILNKSAFWALYR